MRAGNLAARLAFLGAGIFLTASLSRAADVPLTPEQIAFFEKSIRPVLVMEC